MASPSIKRKRRSRFAAWTSRYYIELSMAGMITVFFVLFFARQIFITVPAGYQGVYWMRFFGGTVTEWTFSEGTKVIPPWDKIELYNVRLDELDVDVDALTSDGLRVLLSVSLRYRLYPENVGYVHKHIGPDYRETLILPKVSYEIRNVISSEQTDLLYSAARDDLAERIAEKLSLTLNQPTDNDPLSGNFVDVEDVLIRSIQLPEAVQSAIAAKKVQRQRVEAYEYILQRERLESARKVIEAEGIRAFQDTVSKGINPNYLRWKGIDATLKLAESNNSKIVVIGGNEEGMPLILGGWDTPNGTVPAEDAKDQDGVENESSENINAAQSETTGTVERIAQEARVLLDSLSGKQVLRDGDSVLEHNDIMPEAKDGNPEQKFGETGEYPLQ
ncbi:prohibitin family protein [Roseovarius aestuarii]|nr:prohibitin family protein [Roseovarius aestuarii]